MSEAKVVLRVEGMGCAGCTISVQEALEDVEGVRQVAVDLAFGRAEVTLDRPVPLETLLAAVEEAGYEAQAVEQA
ncbi:heavy metal-associated domain-containing protein [Geminicoccaceae bacterium 1502E]|nr:heavy metal-associated domain-containing protein [Geminicoccaceae bacterium 1502E]